MTSPYNYRQFVSDAFIPPDPITFVISPHYLNRPLYPRQATVLKVIFLRTDMLTDYDREVIAEWETSFSFSQNNGVVPGIIDRMYQLRDQGAPWFREILLVMGRRAGKGYISALATAYVLWTYLSTYDPQGNFGIDRSKRFACFIYAGRKEQARDNLWRDIFNVVKDAPCFKPYMNKQMGESFSLWSPKDIKDGKKSRNSNMDESTFYVAPLPATPMSGRGYSTFCVGFDEMAHMINSGANRSSEEVWVAATPALDQFKQYAFIVCPSSPWEMTGQFYQEWLHAQEIDEEGEFAYPDIFMLQLASWEIYLDWERAHTIDLFPSDWTGRPYVDSNGIVGKTEREREYPDGKALPRLPQLKLAIQEYDTAMQRLEKADPDMFAVERLSHWQTSLDAYLDPKLIDAMFDHGLVMQQSGLLSRTYKGHADPSLVNDNFGVAVAHTEVDAEGFQTVVFDHIHHWDPADSVGHKLDYVQINEELWTLISSYPIDDMSFDQFNSAFFEADLSQRAMRAQLPKRINIHIVPSTAQYNLRVAETFKVALNQGWVKAPRYDQAIMELKFLQMKNNKVKHPDMGPCQHDDVARSIMEVVYGLLERQVASFLMSGAAPLSPALLGGSKPWMSPSRQDVEVFQQFSNPMRRGEAFSSPSRGRPRVMGGGGRPRLPGRP